MKKFILLILLSLYFTKSFAYFAISNVAPINPNKPVRIIISGVPENLGNLLFNSGLTKARTYLTINSDDQILMIGTSGDNEAATNSKGFTVLEKNRNLLTEEILTKYVENLKNVESVDLFAHSNAVEGVILDKNTFTGVAFSNDSKVWDLIKNKITAKSFVMIHGCNAGIKMAPALAMKLEIAVFGALTSSDFQNVYQNENFENLWAFDFDNQNLVLKKDDSRIRMRPLNSAYKGIWGDWTDGGFPTYKLFCGKTDDYKCATSSFAAISSFPSVIEAKKELSKDEYTKILLDFMCPVSTYRDTFNTCQNKLLNLTSENRTYSPYRGITLNCSREKCDAHFKCSTLAIAFTPSKCKLINENSSPSTSFVDDFEFLLSAYDLREK